MLIFAVGFGTLWAILSIESDTYILDQALTIQNLINQHKN